jgi:hypothetical protein
MFVTPVTTCTSGEFRATAVVGASDSPGIWENQSSDPVLSELLDQVIDIVPESIITGGCRCLVIVKTQVVVSLCVDHNVVSNLNFTAPPCTLSLRNKQTSSWCTP